MEVAASRTSVGNGCVCRPDPTFTPGLRRAMSITSDLLSIVRVAHSPRGVLEGVVRTIAEQLGADACWAFLLDAQGTLSRAAHFDSGTSNPRREAEAELRCRRCPGATADPRPHGLRGLMARFANDSARQFSFIVRDAFPTREEQVRIYAKAYELSPKDRLLSESSTGW